MIMLSQVGVAAHRSRHGLLIMRQLHQIGMSCLSSRLSAKKYWKKGSYSFLMKLIVPTATGYVC